MSGQGALPGLDPAWSRQVDVPQGTPPGSAAPARSRSWHVLDNGPLLARAGTPVVGTVLCVHGNPNTVTLDRGTSKLAQGSTGQHALVEIERWVGPLPRLNVDRAPATVDTQTGKS